MAVIIQMADSVAARRVEIGVVQFDGDWPGVFIRGDEALALARQIEMARDRGVDPAFILDRIVALLRSCDVTTKAG